MITAPISLVHFYYASTYSSEQKGIEGNKQLPEDIQALIREQKPLLPCHVSVDALKEIFKTAAVKYEPRFMPDDNTDSIIDEIINWLRECPVAGKLPRGIMLMGKVGSGKTLLMKSLVDVVNWFRGDERLRNVKVVPSYAFVDAYSIKGAECFESIECKTGGENFTPVRGSYIIDDFGAENILSHYGSRINVLESVILRRYDNKVLTLATTNLAQSALKEFYGERAWSRMKEMFIFLELKGNDRRG